MACGFESHLRHQKVFTMLKFLCKIGWHKYTLRLELNPLGTHDYNVPFEAVEYCTRCGKEKERFGGTVGTPIIRKGKE